MQSVSSAKHLIHRAVCPSAALRPWPGKVLEDPCAICPPYPRPQLWVTPRFPGNATSAPNQSTPSLGAAVSNAG